MLITWTQPDHGDVDWVGALEGRPRSYRIYSPRGGEYRGAVFADYRTGQQVHDAKEGFKEQWVGVARNTLTINEAKSECLRHAEVLAQSAGRMPKLEPLPLQGFYAPLVGGFREHVYPVTVVNRDEHRVTIEHPQKGSAEVPAGDVFETFEAAKEAVCNSILDQMDACRARLRAAVRLEEPSS